MNSPFATPRPKRFVRCAAHTLLLALPLSGFAFQLPLVQAQPATTLPAKKSPAPLSEVQKAAIAKLLAVSTQERLCNTRLDLKIENATLETIIARLGETIPKQELKVEVRNAQPVRVSFELKQTTVGNVLDHVAALAGAKLFVLEKGLLIAPASQLTEAESKAIAQAQGGEWAKSTAAGGSSWSARDEASMLFTKAVAQELIGKNPSKIPNGVFKTTFGEFSPESKAMLTEMSGWLNRATPRPGGQPMNLFLSPSSPISVEVLNWPDSNEVRISFGPEDSNPSAGMVSDVIKRMK